MGKIINLKSIEKLWFQNRKPLYVKIEDRIKLGYKEYGMFNHGEVMFWTKKNNYDFLINYSDSDPWDVVIPGYDFRLPANKIYAITKLIGIVQLNDGNSKLIVGINKEGFNEDLAHKQIADYFSEYKYQYNKSSHLLEPRCELLFYDTQ